MPKVSEKLVLIGFVLTAIQVSAARADQVSRTAPAFEHAEAVLFDAQSVMVNGHVQLIEGDVLTRPRSMQRGIGVSAGMAVWEDGIVPYYIDPALQPFVIETVYKAVDTWNDVAGISLVEINPDDVGSPVDYLHFTPANGCASWIGRQGGAQPVWTAPSCSAGSMMHEIGHALGLEHEHTRPDRDQYITIVWQNIDVEKVRNFDITDTNKQNYGPYDYASIMHYGEFFFSANGGPTIRKLVIDNAQMGQRIAPSAGDIAAITALYASDVSLVSNVVNEAGQSEVSLLATNEYLQGANQIDIELNIGTAQLLANNNSDWQCTVYNETLKCSKDRLGGGSQSSLVLLLDQHKSERDLNPRLVSKTPDENLTNNNGAFSPAAALAVFSDNASEQDYTDKQLQASAGGVGLWMFGLMAVLAGRRLQS